MSRLNGFYLLGTDQDMRKDCIKQLDHLAESDGAYGVFSARFVELSAALHRHGHSLNTIASEYSPSGFVSSTVATRDEAKAALEACPEYCKCTQVFWEEDSFLTLAMAKGDMVEDDECNYKLLAQKLSHLARGDSDGVPFQRLGLALVAFNDTTCEEFRSSACSAVMSMFFPRDIVLTHQLPVYIRTSKASCLDLAMSSFTVQNMGPTPRDYSILFEFKVKVTEGSLNEAFMYGITLMQSQQTSKVLVFIIEGLEFSVHSMFWSNGRFTLAQLQPRIRTDSENYDCFAKWLRAAVWYSRNANLNRDIPNRPFFCVSEKCYAMRSVYHDGERVIKVYDTVNKSQDEAVECIPNISLIQDFCPQPVEVLYNFPGFCAISLRAVFSKTPHIPKSVNQLRSFISEVIKFHAGGYLLADLRPPNVLYPDLEDLSHTSQAYLIDFDIARPSGLNHTYPASFRRDGLEISRHPEAKAGAVIEVEHDTYAVHECLKYYARTGCCDSVKDALKLVAENDSLDVLLAKFE